MVLRISRFPEIIEGRKRIFGFEFTILVRGVGFADRWKGLYSSDDVVATGKSLTSNVSLPPESLIATFAPTSLLSVESETFKVVLVIA
jgi:hypothetical protein